jgi:hypothetical protein
MEIRPPEDHFEILAMIPSVLLRTSYLYNTTPSLRVVLTYFSNIFLIIFTCRASI